MRDYIIADVHASPKAMEYVKRGFKALTDDAAKYKENNRLFILGDLWDHKDYLRFGSDFLKYFANDIAPYFNEIYIMEGTPFHDFDGFEMFRYLNNVHIITEATVYKKSAETIIFLPQKDTDDECIPKLYDKDGKLLGENLTWPELSKYNAHYLFGHFYVSGASYNGVNLPKELITERPIVQPEDLIATKAEMIFLGHIHKRQPELEENGIRYCGSMYAKNWGEIDTKEFYVNTDEEGLISLPYGNPRKYILEDENEIKNISENDLYILRKKDNAKAQKMRIKLSEKISMIEKFKLYAESKNIKLTDGMIAKIQQIEEGINGYKND